jgi:hypothetical protein
MSEVGPSISSPELQIALGRNIVEINFNKDGMDQLQRDLEEQFSAGVKIPLDGSEEDAIQSVKDQLTNMGTVPTDDAVEELVRNARNG